MKSTFKGAFIARSLAIGCALALAPPASHAADDPQVSAFAKVVSNAAKTVGGTNGVGLKSTAMNWPENPDVKHAQSFGTDKRIATIMMLIDGEKANEEKIFAKMKTDTDHLVASLITRLFALSKIVTLVGSGNSINEAIIKDYLDGEIVDLRLVLDHKIAYGIYLKAREQRESKYTMLLMSDKRIVTEYLTFRTSKDDFNQGLANKTTVISLSEACLANPDLCVKLAKK